jgi:hypothetical protein
MKKQATTATNDVFQQKQQQDGDGHDDDVRTP